MLFVFAILSFLTFIASSVSLNRVVRFSCSSDHAGFWLGKIMEAETNTRKADTTGLLWHSTEHAFERGVHFQPGLEEWLCWFAYTLFLGSFCYGWRSSHRSSIPRRYALPAERPSAAVRQEPALSLCGTLLSTAGPRVTFSMCETVLRGLSCIFRTLYLTSNDELYSKLKPTPCDKITLWANYRQLAPQQPRRIFCYPNASLNVVWWREERWRILTPR